MKHDDVLMPSNLGSFRSSSIFDPDFELSNLPEEHPEIVISTQPGLQVPQVMTQCPPGLERLLHMSNIQIRQKISCMDYLCQTNNPNQYELQNCEGTTFFDAHEESCCCAKDLLGAKRAFKLHITDLDHQEVILIDRKFNCCAGALCQTCSCIPGCGLKEEITVEAPPGHVIGVVSQEPDACGSKGFEMTAVGVSHPMRIKGPKCYMAYVPTDKEFEVLSDSDESVALITKKFVCWKEYIAMDASDFNITFPADLHVNMKILIISAAFLIDFVAFEQNIFKTR